jgi:lipopolysaccharide export LptBFGC system permease protein LptF
MSQVVAIAAGSVGGGLVVMLLLVALTSTIICLAASQKRKVYNSSSSQEINEYYNKPDHDQVTTETNVAYKSVVCTETANAGFDIMHGNTEQRLSTTEKQTSKLDIEQNVAYESSNAVQISLGTNVAYYESGRQLEENDYYENDLVDDQYDYIHRFNIAS